MLSDAPTKVTLRHRVLPSTDVLAQPVGGESILLDLASEQYFGLDTVGARIWELLAHSGNLQQVHATLCDEFTGNPAQIESDLLALLQKMADAGLVTVVE